MKILASILMLSLLAGCAPVISENVLKTVDRSIERIMLRPDVSIEEFQQFVSNAQRPGFMRTTPDLARLIERLS